MIEFSGKTSNWKGWSEKFLLRGKRKKDKKLLLGKERVSTQSEYEKAVTDGDKEPVKIGDLNEEAFEDIVEVLIILQERVKWLSIWFEIVRQVSILKGFKDVYGRE